MKTGAAALLPLLIAGTLAGLTYWLERATSGQEQNAAANKRHDPDFIVEKFNVQRFDASGQLVNALVADKMTHYPDDDTTDVVNPDLNIYRAGRPMHVTARQAKMNKDGKEVQLQGQVRLTRPATGDHAALLMETEVLTVYSDDERARSKVPVKITQGTTVLRGSGIDYDGKAQLSNLYGRVQGTFPPRGNP